MSVAFIYLRRKRHPKTATRSKVFSMSSSWLCSRLGRCAVLQDQQSSGRWLVMLSHKWSDILHAPYEGVKPISCFVTFFTLR